MSKFLSQPNTATNMTKISVGSNQMNKNSFTHLSTLTVNIKCLILTIKLLLSKNFQSRIVQNQIRQLQSINRGPLE